MQRKLSSNRPGMLRVSSTMAGQNVIVTKVSSSDVDEHAASLGEWNQRYLQMARGPFSGRLKHIEINDGLKIFRETTNIKISEHFVTPENRAQHSSCGGGDCCATAARSLADSIDAVAEHIAHKRAARQEPPTGQLMAHGQLNREYRETLAMLLGVNHDRDPLDALLAEFAHAASPDGTGPAGP